jgi:hypothetical protein
MKFSTVGGVENMTCVSPAMVEAAAGAPPLNCTVVNFTPATRSNSAAARWGVDPLPDEATFSTPGLDRASAISSLRFLAGTSLLTRMIIGATAKFVTGMKSLSPS